ncbi:glycosyltransferase family 2 protein [Leptospira meyeri]|uniref:glycosyltransferase family 2 protein n=1 Tax=Leptospira meyeri TaxID=29508 RepID=UPI0002BE1999|nr:glycosyltransferase family 2 protein [Leptospira meyeri]PKA27083.1 glycosyltransferase family 2 protein [Leptospira sp. mixed culture ATI2-C-A1]EMJ86812.1 glycosyltransferase, group 2 family protein [Leptospira meyeri serovar Semaranga str. Veldrot Semarang 173]MCW7490361.1 glycosyltransferase family 2 protein [Leptospira meyeri]PKA14090.1 glycosyltransferase family 2 protein [Leptospira meyeri]TGM20801.1 glycosyltransferase family 2 protein [Leptospira meyeri]
MKKPSVSFVIPCLNEEKTLPYVLEKLVKVKKDHSKEMDIEILVSDNGSTDRSITIAKKFGARVTPAKERGYGAALDSGIRNAKGDIIVFADADDTYDFLESPALIRKLVEGNYDMVIGSRLDGEIHKGAMPFLHRYLGTPVINWIINLLYSKKFKIRDSNSGFRCFRKDKYLSWDIKSKGMEFASELLIKALIHDSKMEHVPVSLYPDKEGRVPHLKTWRDGMRHLLRILFYGPHLFERTGLGLFLFFWIQLLIGFFAGRVLPIAGMNLYGIHSMVFFSFLSILGLSLWGTGLLIATKQPRISKIYQTILDLEEDRLFFVLLSGLGIISLAIVWIFLQWKKSGFIFINFEREFIVATNLSLTLLIFGLQAVTAHIMKRD